MAMILEEYMHKAESHAICQEYLDRWHDCGTKRDVFAMGCEIEGAKFLVKSISEGWGPSPHEIAESFPRMINGACINTYADDSGKSYTGSVWCNYDGDFTITTTVVSLINCHGYIKLSKNLICYIYVDCHSDVTIEAIEGSRAIISNYGGKVRYKGNIKYSDK